MARLKNLKTGIHDSPFFKKRLQLNLEAGGTLAILLAQTFEKWPWPSSAVLVMLFADRGASSPEFTEPFASFVNQRVMMVVEDALSVTPHE